MEHLAGKMAEPQQKKKNYMWRNKWRKAVTLINNPTLVVERLQEQVKENRKNYDRAIAVRSYFSNVLSYGCTTVTVIT